MHIHLLVRLTIVASVFGPAPVQVRAMQSPGPRASTAVTGLTLDEARDRARRSSPDLTVAREAVAAATARERQAGAFLNPTLSYQREQTSRDGQSNSQLIASVDQPLDVTGVRRLRTEAARLRREMAEAWLAVAEAQLDHEVVRAYAMSVGADRRSVLADQAANAFIRATTVSNARLAEGDVSGYANRRLRLEAARYAGIRAEAALVRRTARIALATLVATSFDSLGARELTLEDALVTGPGPLVSDSLRALAARQRAELRAVTLEAQAAAADVRLLERERVPVPILSAGFKNEQVIGGDRLNGFVVGLSLPFPLWDRRQGAIAALNADVRRRLSEAEVVRRRISREVDEAAESLRAVAEQLELLRPQLGAESDIALRAAQVAYTEGEITLVEWLDAVRAYQEAESTFAALRSESLIRQSALARAVGAPFSRESR